MEPGRKSENTNRTAPPKGAKGSDRGTPGLERDVPGPDRRVCPYYHQAAEMIGKRWNGAILRILLDGPSRFCELIAAIPEISDRLLSERLRELETLGIVNREITGDRPPRVVYQLTDTGLALKDAIFSIERWAHEWLARGDQSRETEDPGNPL
ncbi:MAG: helix-turn-helix transcriptional regulator [Firmicutes bacterium]|nr:helix-turn-helix transcriptional regulator [Bacillota bacterium]